LVRIGAPQRPEMAAWRYGDQFSRRRRRSLAWSVGIVGTVAGIAIGAPAVGLAAWTGIGVHLINAGRVLHEKAALRTKLPVAGATQPLIVQDKHLKGVTLVRDDNPDGWGLYVPIARTVFSPFDEDHPPNADQLRFDWKWSSAHAVFVGDEALRVAGQLLPKINRNGAGKSDVQRAVEYLETAKDPHTMFAKETARAHGLAPLDGEPLTDFPSPVRLALEMILHEDVERRALEGELAMLEAAWQQAEEVAGISDGLLVPPAVDSWVARLRRRL
jgi:hypothetical protein